MCQDAWHGAQTPCLSLRNLERKPLRYSKGRGMVVLTKTSPTLKLGKVTTDEHVDVL